MSTLEINICQDLVEVTQKKSFSDSNIDVLNDVSPICFESCKSKCHKSLMLGIASRGQGRVVYYFHETFLSYFRMQINVNVIMK